jgi:hypothetical protein
MASAGNVTIRLRAKDEVTPVLRGIKREMWLMQHGRVALALLASGWALVGFLTGVLVAGGIVR